jgi:hypothetical protein
VCTIESALSFLCGSSIDFSEYLYPDCYNRTIFIMHSEMKVDLFTIFDYFLIFSFFFYTKGQNLSAYICKTDFTSTLNKALN